jgi:large subunit ribosomal protein L21
MLAIIETQGKQYLVAEGEQISTTRIKNSQIGSTIVFDKVLLIAKQHKGDTKKNAEIIIGKPYVAGVKVEGKILAETKKKTLLWKFKPKTRYRKRQGYKNYFNVVKIERIYSTS